MRNPRFSSALCLVWDLQNFTVFAYQAVAQGLRIYRGYAFGTLRGALKVFRICRGYAFETLHGALKIIGAPLELVTHFFISMFICFSMKKWLTNS